MISNKSIYTKGILTVVFVGLLLRLFRLDHQSFWYDEIYTMLAAKGQIHDVNLPPYYYWLVDKLTALGQHEFWARLPSALAGTASVGLLYIVCRRWFDRNLSLLAAFLFAISPLHLWYSQEARPYSMLVMFTLLSMLAFQRSIDEPKHIIWKIAFAGFAACAFYAHSVGLALMAILGGHIILTENYRQWPKYFWHFAIACVLIVPGIIRIIEVPPNIPSDPNQVFQPGWFLGYTFWTFAVGFSNGPNLADLHTTDRLSQLANSLWLIGPIVGLFAVLGLTGAYKMFREQPKQFNFFTLWLFVPIIFILLADTVSAHGFNVRYVIIALPAFLVFVAFAILRYRHIPIRYSAAVLACIVSLTALTNYFFEPLYQRENNRAATYHILEQTAKNEIVIVTAPYLTDAVAYYSQSDRQAPFIIGSPTSSWHKQVVNSKNGTIDQLDLEQQLRTAINDNKQFWFYKSRTFHSDPYNLIEQTLNTKYEKIERRVWNGIEVTHYGAKGRLASNGIAEN